MGGTVWIEVEIVHTTERALCVREEVHSTWVPISQVKDWNSMPHRDRLADLERRDRVKLELPEWLVTREELDDLVVEGP